MNKERLRGILLWVAMELLFYWLIVYHHLTESSKFTKLLIILLMVEIAVAKDYFITGSFESLVNNVFLVYARIYLLKYIIKVPSSRSQK